MRFTVAALRDRGLAATARLRGRIVVGRDRLFRRGLAADAAGTPTISHCRRLDLSIAYSSVNAPHVVERQNALQAEGQQVIGECSARRQQQEFSMIQNASQLLTRTLTILSKRKRTDGLLI